MGRSLEHFILRRSAESPRQRYSRASKWSLTVLLAAASLIDPITYTIVYPALPQIITDLNTTADVANLSSTLSFIGPALMPLYWGSMCEKYGRRSVYVISLALCTLFAGLAGAVASINALIAMRVLESFCSCAVTVAGGAVVADIWDVKERGFAMSIYYLGPLTGPAIGPVFGGLLVNAWGWRSVQWFLTAYSALVVVLIVFFLPETMQGLGDSGTSSAEKGSEGKPSAHQSWPRTLRIVASSLFGPLGAISYFRFPIIALIIYLASISFAAIITTATSLQDAFHRPPYDFSYLILGLLYLPMPLGMIPGGLIGGKWADKIMDRVARAKPQSSGDSEVVHQPEDRLRENAWVSVLLLPGALLWYGWAVQYGVTWIVPMIPWFIIGFGTGLVFSLVTTVLTEVVPHRSATMVALNSFGRNLLAAAAGSIVQPLVNAIGTGWLFTMFGIVALGNVAVVIFLRRYGTRWRENVERFEAQGGTKTTASEAESNDAV